MNPQIAASGNPRLYGPMHLLKLFGEFVPPEWVGDAAVYVAKGNVVADAELAQRFGVSARTVANWRRELRSAGLIGWLVSPGQGRVFWLNVAAYHVLVWLIKTERQFPGTEALAEMPVASGMVQ